MRVLKNITRINNGTQITQQEILGEFFNVSSDLISEQCSPVYQNCLPGTQAQHVPQENADYLKATKVDYYYCWLLLKDLVRSGSESLTDRQIIVYEAISNYNFEYINGNLMLKGNETDEEKLKLLDFLPDNQRGWIDRDMILKLLNMNAPGSFTAATLNIEIQKLHKREVLKKTKDPKSRNKFLYAVDKIFWEKNSSLPRPSKIIDPIYNGQPVEVINPFTGEKEVI